MKTRLTNLIVGAAALGSGLGLGTGVDTLLKGRSQFERPETVNEQSSRTGSGRVANTSQFYDYEKNMGYTPLTATGGKVKAEYAIGQWNYTESYTGAIIALYVDIATAPTSNATFVDISVQSKDTTTSSGNLLTDNLALTAGQHQVIVGGSGGFLIGPNQQIVLYSSFGSGAGLVGDWDVKYRETELN